MSNTDKRLDAQAIIEDASDAADYHDWDTKPIEEPLTVLLESLEAESDLNENGRNGAGQRVRNLLTSYAGVQHDSVLYPEVLDVTIDKPIVICGMARSGTTMLHSLLSADPAHRGPQWWECIYPSPPPEEATWATDSRRTKMQADVQAMLDRSPDLYKALPYAADWAAECNTLVQPCLHTVAFTAAFYVPSFEQWYLSTSAAPMYTYHRRALQQLSWRGPKGRWVLKAPPHLFTMPELVAEYPDATLIQIHRDPVKSVPSNASLFYQNKIVNSDTASKEVAGRNILDVWSQGVRRMRQFRKDRPDIRIIDLTYDEMTADPIGTTARLYELMGVTLSPEGEAAVRKWLSEHAREKRPDHRYTLEEFGLSEAAVNEAFGEYEPRSSL